VFLAAGAFLPAPSVAGQEVRGTAVESETGRPLAGAFVSLVDAVGRTTVAALAEADGAFVLSGFQSGRYTLRVERIGYQTWTTDAFDVGPGGTVSRRLEVPISPVDLTELRVAVEGQCGAADDEFLLAWDEARKALDVTRWTEAGRSLRFELRDWLRNLDTRYRSVGRDESNTEWITGRTSFIGLPADELAEGGYVQRMEGGYRYYGLDARTLLSDAFREQHCFALAQGTRERAGQIGLRFEPIDRGTVPDVEGALWLDSRTGELLDLDFQYTGLMLVNLPRRGDATGRLEFQRLPSGAWFVARWWIRTPIHERGGGLAARVVGFREKGGEVIQVELNDGSTVALADFGTLSGSVTDGSDTPLASAEIYLVGTDLATQSDQAGRFRLDLVPPGRYAIGVRHPDPRMARVPDPQLTVDVFAEDLTSVELEHTSAWAAMQLCPAEVEENPSSSVLLGNVVDDVSGEPVAGAIVWLRPGAGAAARAFRSDGAGAYLVCGVAPARALELQASGPDKMSEPVTQDIPAGSLVLLDLEVSGAALTASRADANESVSLRGVVKSAEDDRPLSGARVTILGSGIEQMTGADGTFLMQEVPRGRHQVVTEYLGMASDTAEVDLSSGTVTLALFTMETRPVELPALDVEIERTFTNLQLAGFYQRKERGLGEFIGSEDLQFGDIITAFRRIPGVRLRNCPFVTSFGSRRGGSDSIPGIAMVQTDCWEIDIQRGIGGPRSLSCPPVVYLDGNPISSSFEGMPEATGENPFNRIQSIPRHMIEGIEVHRNAATAPAMYRGFGSRCGIILVWTKRGVR
jgi:hypothetical protein